MRVAILAVAMVGLATRAFGADLDDDFIRGSSDYVPTPQVYYNWSGFYGGAQAGYGSSRVQFGGGVSSLVAYILRNTAEEDQWQPSTWTTLQDQTVNAASYGVFAGYNAQWDDAVLGLELNYNHTSLNAADTSSMTRWGPLMGYTSHLTVSAGASMTLTDYGSLRGRFGYVFGRFMPYGLVGVALGRAQVYQTANVTEYYVDGSGQTVPNAGYPAPGQTQTISRVAYPWGYVLGLGLDFALTQSVFLRGEYEVLKFGAFNDMGATVQTLRVGAAVKY